MVMVKNEPRWTHMREKISTKDELVKELVKHVLKTPRIIDAFRTIDRRDFVPNRYRSAYRDVPLHIGRAQTISQPYTVGLMLEQLQPDVGQKILDVGSGSGWTTALLAHIVGKRGHVTGLEIVPKLVELGTANVRKYDLPQASIQRSVEIDEYRSDSQFDRILVSAASKKVPRVLLENLRPGGIMVIPIQDSLLTIHKDSAGNLDIQKFEQFAFVPLI